MHKDYENKQRKHFNYKDYSESRTKHHNNPKILKAQNQAVFEDDRKILKSEYKH